MRLIILHGPPAAGKLTVANELGRRTGFKVFHNHLSIACILPVFEFGSPPFNHLVEKVRMDTIAEAARADVDLIHTFVYAYGQDDQHFARIISSAEDNGGEVNIVLLHCRDDIRRERITNESRVVIGKLTDPESIETSRQQYDLLSPLPGSETLVLDTSDIEPGETAELIIAHYGLKHS